MAPQALQLHAALARASLVSQWNSSQLPSPAPGRQQRFGAGEPVGRDWCLACSWGTTTPSGSLVMPCDVSSVCALERFALLARIWQHAMASLEGARLAGAPPTGPTAGLSMSACTPLSQPAASAVSATPQSSSDENVPEGCPLSFTAARTACVNSDSSSPLAKACIFPLIRLQ
eukprot:3491874-Rhodomonas_salina.3